MKRETVSVSGMSCTGCEQNVETALTNLDGVSRVDADHDGGTVEIVAEDGVAADELHATIKKAGYDPA